MFSLEVVRQLAEAGIKSRRTSPIREVSLFQGLFQNENIYQEKLEERNDGLTYKELLARYLFLNSVLDQGPDMEGVRLFLVRVTNSLYEIGIKYLHNPNQFFDAIDMVSRIIHEVHDQVKFERKQWAEQNLDKPASYNLFLDNARQLTPYILFRWGSPLAVILRLQREGKSLLSYIELFRAAEEFATAMKSDIEYGLGKAIGNKATHLFVKWLIHTYKIVSRSEPKWTENSYELPFDSNAGRVLFMSGYIFEFIPLENLWEKNKDWQIFRREMEGTVYIRVTNLREKGVVNRENFQLIRSEYFHVIDNVIEPSGKKTVPVFQLSINSIIEKLRREGFLCGIGDVDDGLIHVGTEHCLNKNPKCSGCDLEMICHAHLKEPHLKTTYHT